MQHTGPVTIRIENCYSDETSVAFDLVTMGEYVKVIVTDTGFGIPEEIIDPFSTTIKTEKIRGLDFGYFSIFSAMAARIQNREYVKPFFQKLQTSIDQGNYSAAATVLIAYE